MWKTPRPRKNHKPTWKPFIIMEEYRAMKFSKQILVGGEQDFYKTFKNSFK